MLLKVFKTCLFSTLFFSSLAKADLVSSLVAEGNVNVLLPNRVAGSFDGATPSIHYIDQLIGAGIISSTAYSLGSFTNSASNSLLSVKYLAGYSALDIGGPVGNQIGYFNDSNVWQTLFANPVPGAPSVSIAQTDSQPYTLGFQNSASGIVSSVAPLNPLPYLLGFQVTGSGLFTFTNANRSGASTTFNFTGSVGQVVFFGEDVISGDFDYNDIVFIARQSAGSGIGSLGELTRDGNVLLASNPEPSTILSLALAFLISLTYFRPELLNKYLAFKSKQ